MYFMNRLRLVSYCHSFVSLSDEAGGFVLGLVVGKSVFIKSPKLPDSILEPFAGFFDENLRNKILPKFFIIVLRNVLV